MATVYLARDAKHDRQVALKVLDPELGAVIGAERFLSEIRVTANLQHPNLLPLFDSGEADGLLFYVMPFVQGESLRGRLGRELYQSYNLNSDPYFFKDKKSGQIFSEAFDNVATALRGGRDEHVTRTAGGRARASR